MSAVAHPVHAFFQAREHKTLAVATDADFVCETFRIPAECAGNFDVLEIGRRAVNARCAVWLVRITNKDDCARKLDALLWGDVPGSHGLRVVTW